MEVKRHKCPLHQYLSKLTNFSLNHLNRGFFGEHDSRNAEKPQGLRISNVFTLYLPLSFPSGSDGKESACSAGDPDSVPVLGRSPGEGNGYTLLEISMDSRV